MPRELNPGLVGESLLSIDDPPDREALADGNEGSCLMRG